VPHAHPSASSSELRPPPRRPIQWRRAAQALWLLHEGRPENAAPASYGVVDALGGQSDARLLRRVLATEEGRRLARERPSLPDVLGDHDRLRSLPDASFGRAYLALAERHGLNALDLIAFQHSASRDYAALDPLRQWFSDRLTVMHDLWHVLVGYDATTAGESAIVCFSIAQGIHYRPMPVYVAMLLAKRLVAPRFAWEAYRRGRRARLLAAQPYEMLLPLPLAAIRERLGLAEPERAHHHVPQNLLIPA
jgi:ubiquinone biosynthesis protein COQ4